MKAVIGIVNSDLSREAINAAIERAPRLKNWKHPIPSKRDVEKGTYQTELIHYKGKFKGYTGGEYYPLYTSRLTCDNLRAVYECGFAGAIKSRSLRAPAGTEWDHDGSLVMRSDYNVEYHPTTEDLFARDFARRVWAGLKEARVKRAEALRRAAEQNRLGKLWDRAIDSAWVTLEDSRRAGNCLEGSLRFAETRLGLSRDAVLSGRWLVTVHASTLMRMHDQAAERAVRCAVERECTISI